LYKKKKKLIFPLSLTLLSAATPLTSVGDNFLMLLLITIEEIILLIYPLCSNILTKCDLYFNIEEFKAFWEK